MTGQGAPRPDDRPPPLAVYRSINRITAAFAQDGIAKGHINLIDQYQYRSIDDLLNRLGPLLGKHRLCVLPRVLRRECADRESELGTLLVSVRLLVAFDLVSARDGSCHTIKAWGEALDPGDKGTAKAMSAAFKHAMLEVFCVPVATDDADATSLRLTKPKALPEPPQGWTAWAADIMEMIDGCETVQALDRVRTRQAGLLGSLKRDRSDLYQTIGERFQQRQAALTPKIPVKPAKRRTKAPAAERVPSPETADA